jgi:hypothetical protein
MLNKSEPLQIKTMKMLFFWVMMPCGLKSTNIRHPHTRVKHCAYVHSVTTLLNPRGVTTVSHKYSLTAARHATVVLAVLLPCTVQTISK